MSEGRGYFIAPDGEVIDVPDRHITMVVSDPRRFGTTKRWVAGVYQKHDEPPGFEGQAREQILRRVLKNGWIRVREHRGPGSYWAVEFARWSPQVAGRVRRWARNLLARRGCKAPTDRHAEVRLAGLDGFLHTLSLSRVACTKGEVSGQDSARMN